MRRSITVPNKMKPDQERVNNLLRDTVTLLCKNGLTYSDELRVEALIGVTVDSNDVFLVHINERFGPGGETKSDRGTPAAEATLNNGGQTSTNTTTNSGDTGNNTSHNNTALSVSGRDSVTHTSQPSPAHAVQRTGSSDSGSVASPSTGGVWGQAHSSQSRGPQQVDLSRVKLESVDASDEGVEECLVVRSPQAVAHQARMVAGQRRSYNRSSNSTSSSSLHHHLSQQQSSTTGGSGSGGGDDAQAMRQQYSQSQSMASSDGSFTDYDPDSSEPPLKIKKQAADDQGDPGEEDGDSTFYQGGGGGGGGGDTSQSAWPNLADLAAQHAHQAFQDAGDGHLTTETGATLPGCSTWPMPAGSQRGLLAGTPGSDMASAEEAAAQFTPPSVPVSLPPVRRRKSRTSHNKPHTCLVAGCGRTFFHSQDARRHERQVHNIKHQRGVSPYKLATTTTAAAGTTPAQGTRSQQGNNQDQGQIVESDLSNDPKPSANMLMMTVAAEILQEVESDQVVLPSVELPTEELGPPPLELPLVEEVEEEEEKDDLNTITVTIEPNFVLPTEDTDPS